MPKGKPEPRYTGAFKQRVIEDMRENDLGYNETMRKYDIKGHDNISKWERIYLEEGASGLYEERRGRANKVDGTQKGRPPKLDKKVEEDLIAENQRLRMELDYLKKLNALVQEKQLQERKRKQSGS